ncbi:MAG: class I SAM-dependent methyltransferase, partial [Candidatus Omnitrophica bacterium]|nr:class I SAM-dependent methyltransferase [Candidatus Omnitrophota bacterium]
AIKIAYKTVQKLPSEKRKLVSIEHKDITEYESDEKYDLIFLIDVVEHLTQKQVLNLFKILKRVLADNGKIFMSTPNSRYERYWYVFKHIMQWPLKPLKSMLRLLKGKMQAKNLREFLVKSFCVLPKKSKSLEIMHVNVMSPAQLRKSLSQHDLVADFFEGLKITDREIVAIIKKGEGSR